MDMIYPMISEELLKLMKYHRRDRRSQTTKIFTVADSLEEMVIFLQEIDLNIGSISIHKNTEEKRIYEIPSKTKYYRELLIIKKEN